MFLNTSSKENLFTIIAKDNIDLNSSSSTASSHYHGACMSLLQFPDAENMWTVIDYNYEKSENTSLKVDKLPTEYANVENLHLSALRDIFIPVTTVNTIDIDNNVLQNAINEKKEWLCSYKINNDCWSSFHASRQRHRIKMNDTSSIMPLIREKVNTLDTQFHCMTFIKDTLKEINSDQTPIDVCDQPVYALTKQIHSVNISSITP